MHPILAQKRWLGLYLAAWLPAGLLITTLVVLEGPARWLDALALMMPLSVFYALQCLPVWYLCRSFPLRPAGALRIAAILGVAALLSASLWLFVGSGWAALLVRAPRFASSSDLLRRTYPLLFIAGVLLFFLAATAGYLLIAAMASRAAEKRTLELKIMAQEAELRGLKAQINPHFLFNSLNSVMALIGSKPEEARRMCLLLSDFLRSSLKTTSLETMPLAEELSLLENYLDIERIRYGARLLVKLEIEGGCGSCLVPPLLLQPLVENAVIHGIAHRLEGGEIEVRASRHGSRLTIHVINPCDPDRPRAGRKGIGIRNVQSRLEALYGNQARIDTLEQDGVFRAEISLPACNREEP